jgi:hypothetical protein
MIECARPGRSPLFYVGRATDLSARWGAHRRSLRAKKHYNAGLTNAWAAYGEDAFTFNVLKRCPVARLEAMEQLWLNIAGSMRGKGCLNGTFNSRAPMTGRSIHPRTRAAVARAATGRVKSNSERASISAKLRGRIVPDDQKAKMSAVAILRGARPGAIETLAANAAAKARPVIATSLRTGLETYFPSMAATVSGGFTPQNIWQLLHVRGLSHRGHSWRFA